ncbi:MAG: thiol oxidoreductase, partial [Devosia sp.]|nr:thiol oxidoreductase [Devosia sp.]
MHKRLTAFLVIILIAGLAVADDGGTRSDLTPKDLKRVQRVTAPTSDFSKPENFEQLPGGAGTIKKRVNQDIF